jgi:hypothetical protein
MFRVGRASWWRGLLMLPDLVVELIMPDVSSCLDIRKPRELPL